MEKINNGLIKTFKDKLDNTHFDFVTGNDYKSNKKIEKYENLFSNNRFEIYSVETNKGDILSVGNKFEAGFISDFFIYENNVYVRFIHILSKNNDIILKKNCSKI